MATLPPMRLTGARILRDGALRPDAVSVENGVFTDTPLPDANLSGYLVLPGIVDLHGDAFERHIAPRPTAPFPIASGLATTERDAAAHGVTTAWLAQCWSWEGGMRGPDFAEAVMVELDAYRPKSLIDLHLQIRLETHMIGSRERLLAAVEAHGVDYVVFNNHLPEALDTAHRAPHRFAAWAERAGYSAKEFHHALEVARAQEPALPRHLLNLAEGFDRLGVRYGSHDDPDGDTRERFRVLGAHICEFPTGYSPASAAKAMDDVVVMGAPNVVRGGSQAGGVSAMGLITRGLCDALVSDYHYPSLADAAWVLADLGVRPLPEAWEMISTVPARIIGLDDRGRIERGKRADFVVIHEDSRRIEATISAGRIAHLSGALAGRLLGQGSASRLAAE
jgi:alpha-D-ribose 1-methylphosphonate 5-triphosphate diphosphatase